MRIVSANEAVEVIRDDWALTIAGFGYCGGPDALLTALEDRFTSACSPTNLTLLFGSGCGDGESSGLNRLAHLGLVGRIIGSDWQCAPRLGALIDSGGAEGHNWPMDVLSHLYQAVAQGHPGVWSETGIGTWLDPRESARNGVQRHASSLVTVSDARLFYPTIPVKCALLRGSRADSNGNISMELEANVEDQLSQAMAVRRCGGVVIVQVMDVVCSGVLNPREVRIPGHLVDFVVHVPATSHRQTVESVSDLAVSGNWHGSMVRCSRERSLASPPRAVLRRAAWHLQELLAEEHRWRPVVANIGWGLQDGVVAELYPNGLPREASLVFAQESGVLGGRPLGGKSYGAAWSPSAMVTPAEQFEFFAGGGLDIAFLPFGRIDSGGRVDIARDDDAFRGVGAFTTVAQSAKQLIFCGSFADEKGSNFIESISRVCFDPKGQSVCKSPLIITERAMLRATDGALELVELASGFDLQEDLIDATSCPIRIPTTIKAMPAMIFEKGDLVLNFVS